MASEGDEDKPKRNPGSARHLELCSRPCTCSALGQCINLADCNFCCLPHSNRSATLHRQAMKEMCFRFLFRCLPSAVDSGLELEAQDVLQFEAQLGNSQQALPKFGK